MISASKLLCPKDKKHTIPARFLHTNIVCVSICCKDRIQMLRRSLGSTLHVLLPHPYKKHACHLDEAIYHHAPALLTFFAIHFSFSSCPLLSFTIRTPESVLSRKESVLFSLAGVWSVHSPCSTGWNEGLEEIRSRLVTSLRTPSSVHLTCMVSSTEHSGQYWEQVQSYSIQSNGWSRDTGRNRSIDLTLVYRNFSTSRLSMGTIPRRCAINSSAKTVVLVSISTISMAFVRGSVSNTLFSEGSKVGDRHTHSRDFCNHDSSKRISNAGRKRLSWQSWIMRHEERCREITPEICIRKGECYAVFCQFSDSDVWTAQRSVWTPSVHCVRSYI